MQLITGSCGGERCINMAVTLREIIKQVQHLEMKLVAGETGLDHEVSWTHMVDSDTISAFLQGQELTFTTGLGLNENLTLLRLVKEVWRNKASGIVINTGPYISEIGQDVIDFANEKGFPVFEAASYAAATSDGSPASRKFTKLTPFTTLPSLTSRQGITLFVCILLSSLRMLVPIFFRNIYKIL